MDGIPELLPHDIMWETVWMLCKFIPLSSNIQKYSLCACGSQYYQRYYCFMENEYILTCQKIELKLVFVVVLACLIFRHLMTWFPNSDITTCYTLKLQGSNYTHNKKSNPMQIFHQTYLHLSKIKSSRWHYVYHTYIFI